MQRYGRDKVLAMVLGVVEDSSYVMQSENYQFLGTVGPNQTNKNDSVSTAF